MYVRIWVCKVVNLIKADLVQVFATHAYNTSEFKPVIAVEEAEKRYRHWEKAVQRSLDLADLSS